MIILTVQQGSVEWCEARAGIPTASEFKNLVSPTGEVRKGEMPRSYLAEKVAEAWLGGTLSKYNTWDMDQGHILEDEAIPGYEFAHNVKVERVGLVLTDDRLVGCSPDGLIAPDGGIEVKCPRGETHVGYLLAGRVPPEYVAQVQGSLYVTGRPWWQFLSYRRNFPELLLTVERDEAYQAALREALEMFLANLAAAIKRMEELNGGPRPAHRKPALQPPAEEPIDLMP